jgi:hypothetical protein
MKKLLVILLVAGLGGAGAWYILKNKTAFDVEDVFPSSPVFYVKFSQVQNNLEKLQASRLWSLISKINYDKIIAHGQINPAQKQVLESTKTQLSDPMLWSTLSKFFGKEFALAIYPLDVGFDNLATVTDLTQFFSNIILVTKVSKDIQLAEFLSRTFSDYKAEITTETSTYRKHTIHLVTIPDGNIQLGVTRFKDLLVVSVGDKGVKKAIDAAVHQNPSLKNDGALAKAKTKWIAENGITGFWDVERFMNGIKGEITKISGLDKGNPKQNIDNFFKTIQGFKILSFSVSQEELLKLKLVLFMDSTVMDARVAKYYSTCTPLENRSADFVPQDVLGYSWGSCFNLNYYWTQMKEELAKIEEESGKKTGSSRINQFETMAGLSIESDIIPAFGDEIGGFLRSINMPSGEGQGFPIPDLTLFIEVGDKSKMETLMKKLTDNPLLMFKEEDYNGLPLHYLALPTEGKIEPGYCYVGNYLLLSSDMNSLKKAIDVSKDPSKALSNAASFKEINAGLPSKNTGVQFIKVDDLMKISKELVGWSNQWAQAQEEKYQAFKSGTKKRLDDINAQIEDNVKEIANLKTQIETAKTTVSPDASASVPSAATVGTNMSDLEAQMVSREKDSEALKEKKQELEEMVGNFEKAESSQETERDFYLNEALYPLMDAFQSIHLLGAHSIIENDMIETNFSLKIE